MREEQGPVQFGAPDAWALRAGYRLVAGVDEAGIGAMAGPVVAAAVLLAEDDALLLVGDSKALTPEQREAAYREILDHALSWSAAVVEPDLVDRINVWHAAHLAMRRALAGLDVTPEFALIDGLPPRGIRLPHRAIVDGDALSPRIGAASIVAKVTRDRIMQRMDLLYRGYGLAQNKGYCTPAHRRAVKRLGPSVIHRRSYVPVDQARGLRLPFDPQELARLAEGDEPR
ncbi:MAG: ribonuclease HII [Armatimonadota bacterium]